MVIDVSNISFNREDVMAYLEYKMINNESSQEEDELYIDLVYKNDLKIHNKTLHNLLKEMSDEL